MRIRDVSVSSSGMTDKTMGKFYNVVAFVKRVVNKHPSRNDYRLNVEQEMESEPCLYFSVLNN